MWRQLGEAVSLVKQSYSSLVHTSRSKYYIQNLLLISGFEDFQNIMKNLFHDMRFFFVIIKCCSNYRFLPVIFAY